MKFSQTADPAGMSIVEHILCESQRVEIHSVCGQHWKISGIVCVGFSDVAVGTIVGKIFPCYGIASVVSGSGPFITTHPTSTPHVFVHAAVDSDSGFLSW